MQVTMRGSPTCVNSRHIHPGRKGLRKGVEKALSRHVDFRNAEDVIDIGDDSQAFIRNEPAGCVAGIGTFCVDIEALDGSVPIITWQEAIGLNRDKGVKVACKGGEVGEVNSLGAAVLRLSTGDGGWGKG